MSKRNIRKEDALQYHEDGKPGKIEVVPTKATKSQRDLALAYSPGVAWPCREIYENPNEVYRYTSKGNLVAVISDGSAVLGLGNIGPAASKPVMEGKGILFKIFAGIDVFDIELNTKNIEAFIDVVKAMEPTFGGVNLEDIKAPDCFEIEERLKEEMDIPVMHDDQHGTAIIAGAALLNAAKLAGKPLNTIKTVVSGAGASALSCVRIMIELGLKRENIIVCDSKGVVRSDREKLDKYKASIATDTDVHTLEEAIVGADFFLGLSVADALSPKMLKSMAKDPIVFALANPDPEIDYDLAMDTRPDAIMATGRSDHPNQVNNVLGFPYIFRGALDVRAKSINEEMKLAAVKAIADLAKEPVPDMVVKAYDLKSLRFGRDYIIPKPFDFRLLTKVTPAVAKAAMETGVAQIQIEDWEAYEAELKRRMGIDENILQVLSNRAKQQPKRIVFAEAEDYRVLKAVQIAQDEGLAKPILLGDRDRIAHIMEDHHIEIDDLEIIDPRAVVEAGKYEHFAQQFFEKRHRRGYNLYEAREQMKSRNYFGAMMVETGEADAMISGISRKYSDVLRPALEIIGTYEQGKKVSSMYLMLTQKGPIFFADTTIIPDPTPEELAEIAKLTVNAVQSMFNIKPKVAFLSYSNFGASDAREPRTVRRAVEIAQQAMPDIVVDGEIQANFAFNKVALQEHFPFTKLMEEAPNVLIFPNLSSSNISYKLLQAMGNAEAIGPIILGMKKPVHVLQLGSSVREIVHMINIATIDAQER